MSSDSKEGLVALCSTLTGLSSLAVGLRFYVRKKQRAPIMIDDVSALASLITFIAAAAVSFHMVRQHILGYPNSPASAGEYSEKLQIVAGILKVTSLACSKLSALFFYRRIFYLGGAQYRFHIVIIGTAAVVILWLVVFSFLLGFQCGTHFSALWDGTYMKYCAIAMPMIYGLALSDLVLDVWVLALPIPSIIRLNASRPKKLGVLGVFLLGAIGVFASANRVAQVTQIHNGGPEYLHNIDHERAITTTTFFVTLEAGVSLLAVNLPTLWFLGTLITPFLHKFPSKLLPFARTGSGNSPGKPSTIEVRAQPSTSNMRHGRIPMRSDNLL